MLRKIMIPFCFILLIFLSGCSNTKEIQSDLKTQLEAYISSFPTLNGKSIDAYYSPKTYQLLDDSATGVLTSAIYDFDGDGLDETIAIFVNNNKIDLELLEAGKSKIQKLDSINLLEELPGLDSYEMNLFTYQLGGKVGIFLEIVGNSSIVANGSHYSLLPIYIKEGKLSKDNEISLEGSSLFYDEVGDYMSQVRKAGLTINTIDKSIFEQNDNAVKLFGIKKEHLADFNVDTYYNSQEEKIKYGTITFQNYIESNYKIELEDFAASFIGNNEKSTNYDSSYLGSYTLEQDNDTFYLELSENQGTVEYFLSYYPNHSMHASEELWGSWDTEVNHMYAINENINALATYYFSNIKYTEDKIELEIHRKDMITEVYQDDVIPDGTYIFTKEK